VCKRQSLGGKLVMQLNGYTMHRTWQPTLGPSHDTHYK
jgi:hypothetical protein